MTDLSTCKHCGQQMTAKGANGYLKTFCGSKCNGDHRRALNASKQAEREAAAEAALERNARLLDSYMRRRYQRLARAERQAA